MWVFRIWSLYEKKFIKIIKMLVGIVGLGFVGSAIEKSLKIKEVELKTYDKYKNGGIGSIEDCLDTGILFLALPTLYLPEIEEYDKTAIYETFELLDSKKYEGVIVLKSTIEPETTNKLESKYPNLNIIHNPEFLTARTAFEDFHNQKNIVLGKGENCNKEKFQKVVQFFSTYYPEAEISICKSIESESMKIFVNSFYAVKIQFFNELYLLCQKNRCDFEKVKSLMLKNNWINPMHTNVPGPDGKLSYGGACFPKDTSALQKYMKKLNTNNMVLKATIDERNSMRKD